MSINILDICNRIKSHDCSLSTIDLRAYAISVEELKALKLVLRSNSIVGNILWGELPTSVEANSYIHAIGVKLKNNILGFKYYPSAYEYGLLSIHAYTDANVDEAPTLINEEYNNYLKNWKVQAIYRNDENGYYGALYKNIYNCQLVLAHRGTEFFGLKDELLGHKDVSADIDGIVLNKIIRPIYETYLATEDSIKIAKQDNLSLSFTGHSLGAWLAELSVYFAYKHLDYKITRALTFDSPGSYDFFKSLQPNIHNYHSNFYIEGIDIITYLSLPNIVNSCNSHAGEVYSVSPKITETEIRNFYSSINVDIFMPLITVLGHSLESIIQEFNKTTGTPDNYKEMLDWPCITCSYDPNQNNIYEAMKRKVGVIFSSIGKIIFEPVTTLPIYKMSNMIIDLIQGKIDLSQYLSVIKNEILPLIKQEENFDGDKHEKSFYSKFEAHFDWKIPNPYLQPLKGMQTSPDWHLSQLAIAHSYFSSPPTSCGITNIIQNTILHLNAKYDYILPHMHGKYAHGALNSTESKITIDSLTQAIIRLDQISFGSLQKCIDLYRQPELWIGEIIAKGKHSAIAITKELIDNGIDLNGVDGFGNNLLYHAVSNNNSIIIDLLASNGVNVIKNNNGEDAYSLALKMHNIDVANNLKQYMHISPGLSKIYLDEYGIFDGNDQSNIFIINPEFDGKKNGYKLVIDKFDNIDKIDLSGFSNIDFDDLEFERSNFANQDGVRISLKETHDDIVTLLNINVTDITSEMIILGKGFEASAEL